MSKTSKNKSKQKRLDQKRARKAAMNAQWQKFAELGKNKKSKRFKRGRKKTISGVDHPNGSCGNPGCKKCYGVFYDSFLRKGKPYRMPHWMYLRWLKEKANKQ